MVLDKYGKSVRISTKKDISATLISQCFKILEDRNDELHVTVTRHCGKFKIDAKLKKYHLSTYVEGQTLTPIEFLSSLKFIHLPLLPSKKNQQIFFPKLEGGSTEYTYLIANTSIFGLSKSSYVYPKEFGTSSLEIRDKLNFRNSLIITVIVSQPEELEFLPKNMV